MFLILIIAEYLMYAVMYTVPALLVTFLGSRCFETVNFDRSTFAFVLVCFLCIKFVINFKIIWKFSKEN